MMTTVQSTDGLVFSNGSSTPGQVSHWLPLGDPEADLSADGEWSAGRYGAIPAPLKPDGRQG